MKHNHTIAELYRTINHSTHISINSVATYEDRE